jgi:hypothetical protein
MAINLRKEKKENAWPRKKNKNVKEKKETIYM